MKTLLRHFSFVGALIVMIGIAGFAPGASAQSTEAQVRITHASPDAPAVDIWVDGEPAVTNLAFGEATGLISLPGGTYDVAVTPAGSADPVADAVISASLPLEAGQAYEVVAVGLLANISAQVYPLDLSPVTDGSARIQFIHASPDAPAVDILANGSPIVEGLSFPSGSGFLEVPAGTYDVDVAVAGTTDIALSVPGVALEAGQVYDVLAIGEVGNGTLTALPLAAPASSATGGSGADSSTHATTVPATGIGSAESTTQLTIYLFGAAFLLAGLALSINRGRLVPERLR